MGHTLKNKLLSALVHDGGHFLTGLAVAFAGTLIALSLGASVNLGLLLGCGLGAGLLPIVQEVVDYFKFGRKVTRDGIHDIATYQPVFAFYFAYTGEWLAVGTILALVVIVEAVFYWGLKE